MLTVRIFRPDDSITDITALLHRAYAALGALGLNYTAVDQAPEITRSRLSRGQCFLAEWAGQLAGTIVVYRPINLVSIYERLGYRRVGFVQWPGKVYRSVVLGKDLQ